MTAPLGQIRGQILIDAKQAIAEYVALRAANAATMSALTGSSRAFIAFGIAATAGGAAIVALFAKAISAAADFQKKIDLFGAVTDASQADMEAVAQKAMEMGRTTIFSAGQMADAFVEFGKAGVNTKDILAGVADSVVALASAAGIGLTDASDIIISTMQTFKISANDTMKIADLLAGAANSSIVEVRDLGVSLKYVGGIAAATGIPLKSVVTALSLLGQAGIKGSTAGTSLRQILVSLNATSKKSQDELKKLGIITKDGTNLFIDQAGHLKPLDQIFQILQTHTAGLTDAQRLSALKIIFNNRALAAANILLKDGAKGFSDMAAQIDKISAADVAARRLDNLAGDVTKLKNTFQTFLIQAGGPFQNVMRVIVQGLTNLIKAFANLPEPIQTAIVATLAIVGALLLIAGTVSLAVGSGIRLVILFTRVAAAMRILMIVIRAVVIILRVLSIALLTNPIGLIVTAVALLVVGFILLYTHSKRFRDIIASIGNALKTAFLAVVDFVKGIPQFFIDLWHNVQEIWNNITSAITGAVQAAIDFILSVWSTVTEAVLGPIRAVGAGVSAAFQAVYDAIANAINNVIGFIQRNWRVLILITGPFGIMVDIITAHWAAINNVIHVAVQQIVNFLTTIWNVLVATATAAWNAIVSAATAAWNFLVGVTTVAWNAIKAVFAPVIAFIVAVVTTGVNTIRAIVSAVWNAVSAVTSAVWNAIRNAVAAAVNGILAAVRLISQIVGIVAGALSAAFNAVVRGVATILGYFGRFAGMVLGAIGNLAGTLVGPAVSLITGFFNAIVSSASRIWGYLSNIGSTVASAVGDLGGALFSAGVSVITGFISGIVSKVGDIIGTVKDAIGGAINFAKGLLGIGSPSRVFHQMGRWTVQGFANGIEHDKRLAINALTDLDSVINSHTKGLSIMASPSLVNTIAGDKFGRGTPPIVITQQPNQSFNVTMTVPADKIKDVAKLIDIVQGIPQAVRAR
jgi:TP901 family phage tail tape measure protein